MKSEYMTFFRRTGFILLGSLLFLQPVSGDQLTFRNGRTLDCTILAVNDDYVEVSLGTGTMRISRKQLTELIRSDENTTKPRQEPTAENILSAQHAPPAHAELAAEFRELIHQRNAALDAQYMMNLYESQIQQQTRTTEQLVAELKKIHREINTTAQAIKSIQLPEQAPRTYREYKEQDELTKKKSALRDRFAELNATISRLQTELSESEKQTETLKQKINNVIAPLPIYFNAVNRFDSRYTAYKAKHRSDSMDRASKLLFEKIDYHMKRFRDETSEVVVDSWTEGNTTFVRALVNGKTSGIFIFDTGATSVTISEPFARKLGLQLGDLPVQQAVVADGRKVDAYPVMLSSVQIGDAEVKNVAAAVLGNGMNTRADGLLGMSFLRHFTIGMNGLSGKITLTRFSTD
ncbi:TIGR02281 family clan AA aspartic protease [Verrucomicrobia bacterium S94]|nr:TIGR02281 family clan AA aspartic protease [Verrucomicrobia bacterium S94]